MADLRENVDVAMENISSVLPPELEKIKGMCLAAVKKPRDYTRLTRKSCGNLCNLVVS